jgi:uncharacterized membrane protein
MKMKRCMLYNACILLLLFSIAYASEINFGTIQQEKYATLKPGGSKTFEINVFNLGNEPFFVEFEVSSEMKVEVYPKKVELNPNLNTGKWVALGDKYVSVYPVKVIVRAPFEPEKRRYFVNLRAIAYKKPFVKSGVHENVKQVREFTFVIDVIGSQPKKTYREVYNVTREAHGAFSEGKEKKGKEKKKQQSSVKLLENESRKTEPFNFSIPSGYFFLDKEKDNSFIVITIILLMIIAVVLLKIKKVW